MKETKNKALSNKELSNVSGGGMGKEELVECPGCHKRFHVFELAVTTGSGCSEKFVCWRCPSCGHEWNFK